MEQFVLDTGFIKKTASKLYVTKVRGKIIRATTTRFVVENIQFQVVRCS